MRLLGMAGVILGATIGLVACDGDDEGTGGAGGAVGGSGGEAGGGVGGGGSGACAGPCPVTEIKHLVIVLQENHSFDNHFGRYCTAPAGSAPSCTDGPACCERGPDTDPGANAAPFVLDDAENGAHDPIHQLDCSVSQIDGGKMDQFVEGPCGDPHTFAYAPEALVKPYWDLAVEGALGDRYFHSIAGASSANDMYFARAQYVFTDNAFEPEGAVGADCTLGSQAIYGDPTLGDLLNEAGVPWAVYAEGYDVMAQTQAVGKCPTADAACPSGVPYYPCVFDPADIPFLYYASLREDLGWMRDYSRLALDIDAGELPAVSLVRAIGFRSEHPGAGNALSTGIAWATSTIEKIRSSAYADKTLILLTYDEGGGYFDHVAPPPDSPADGKPYGVRVPVVAIGPFARKNHVSHVTMEHSSIVRFIEYNWLSGQTGQLGGRDAIVSNIGSLLDPAATGEAVPE